MPSGTPTSNIQPTIRALNIQLRKLENASHNPYTALTPVKSRDLASLSEQIAEQVR